MSADDLATGMAKLEDAAVQERVAEGDLSDFTGLELTDEEATLLAGAASEYPEVVGHDIRFGLMNLNLDVAKVAPADKSFQDMTNNQQTTAQKAAEKADSYIRS